MQVGTQISESATTWERRREVEHGVQSVFSEVLEEAGRRGYASAEVSESSEPLDDRMQSAWSDWFDFETVNGRYQREADALQLKQAYGDILQRVCEEGGLVAPKEFLEGLSREELAVVQRIHRLADPIQVEPLSEEGAMNLLLPPAAQIDLDRNGLTQSGIANGAKFPDSNTPPEVAAAWEEATEGLNFEDRMLFSFAIISRVTVANIVCDDEGKFLYRREPGDPDWVNPMASPDFSYQDLSQDYLDMLEMMRNELPPEQYESRRAFWSGFKESLGKWNAS